MLLSVGFLQVTPENRRGSTGLLSYRLARGNFAESPGNFAELLRNFRELRGAPGSKKLPPYPPTPAGKVRSIRLTINIKT